MDKKTKYGFLAVLIALIGCITLGAIGTTAMAQHFYWIAFVANIIVYGCVIYNILKANDDPE